MDTPPPLTPEPLTPQISEHDRSWCIGLHLSGLVFFISGIGHIIAPLIIWLIKRADDPLIDATGKEVLNFQISYSVYALVVGALWCLSLFLCLFLVGFLLLPFVYLLSGLTFIAWLVLTIIAAVKTSNGEQYRYPGIIRFLS